MIISQSFKTKNPDGSFGNEVALSTISDLVFYEAEENKTLTQKTLEIEADIAKEIKDRTDADEALGTRIDDEESARQQADNLLQTNLENKINNDIAAEKSARESADSELLRRITQEATDRGTAVTSLRDELKPLITSNEDNIAANTADINALKLKYNSETKMSEIDSSISELQASVTSLNEIVGSITDPVEQTILEKLADIEARLTALEETQQTI